VRPGGLKHREDDRQVLNPECSVRFEISTLEDPVERIAKRVALWMALGAFVPIFWGILGFILFNARQSTWTDLFWNLVYITCPPWLLPENDWSMVVTPLANAALYGIAAFFISIAIRVVSKRTSRSR
jgi:hypothetical protein